MSTVYKTYAATIPRVVLAKNLTIVNSFIGMMKGVGVSSVRDEHGLHFVVVNDHDSDGYVPKGCYLDVDRRTLLRLTWQLTEGDMLQLVHEGTCWSCDLDRTEEVGHERQLKESFYEGLFSHSL